MIKRGWYLLCTFVAAVSAASLNRRFASRHDHIRHADQIGPGSGECGKRIDNPPTSASMDCPSECPFSRPDTNHFCSFSCVKKDDCGKRNPLTSFADPRTRVCSPCAIPGCVSCGNNRTHCVECGDRMVLRGHECVAKFSRHWEILYWAVGIIVAALLIYLLSLSLRPEVNHGVLKRAEEYRHSVKLRDMDHIPNRPYTITTNLASEIISGPGIMMHFSWQRYVIIWAIIVAIVMYTMSWIPVYSIYPKVGEDAHPNDRDVFQTCAAVGSDTFKAEVNRADWFYLVFTIGVYIFSTVGTFLLLWVQQNAYKKYARATDKIALYAVHARGFPEASGKDLLEEEYKTFFEQSLQEAIPGVRVIGVSLVWDEIACCKESGLNICLQVHQEIEHLDRKRDKHVGIFTDFRASTCQFEDITDERTYLSPGKCGTSIDNLILGRGEEGTESWNCWYKGAEVLTGSLEKMRSTGECFVVFKTVEQRNRAVAMERLKYKDVDIHLSAARHDPRIIYWEHYGKQGNGRVLRFLGMCIVLMGCVILWTICIYWPYASYVLQWMTAPGVGEDNKHGVRDEFFQMSLLTVPIILGNQVMYQVCDSLADRIRCETRGLRDLGYVVMYTVFITFQTVLDIGICISIAYGHHTEDSWKLAQASGVLGPKAVAQNPSIRELLYLELVAYLYPVTLGVCYLLEPIFLGVLPYFLFKWIIRSRVDIGVFEAQNCFAPLPFDMCRYGDIIISIICCVLVCFIASPDVYIVFLWLLGMLCFCYCWDHWRFLRLSQTNKIETNLMDEYCTMMLSVPCALLASCVVFRRYGAHYKDFSRDSIPLACVAAFFAHLALHICVIQWLIWENEKELRRKESEMMEKHHDLPTYEEFAHDHAFNHFNTNWVHCLRSKYIYQRSQPSDLWCIPARHGREYLLKKAPEFGQYYEMEDPLEKTTVTQDLRDIVDNVVSIARSRDKG